MDRRTRMFLFQQRVSTEQKHKGGGEARRVGDRERNTTAARIHTRHVSGLTLPLDGYTVVAVQWRVDCFLRRLGIRNYLGNTP